MDAKPTVTLKADRQYAYCHGGSFRYLACTATLPENSSQPFEPDKDPLNIGLVIDASSSMRRGRLKSAINTSCELVDRLGPQDQLSIVTFSSDVVVHLSQVAMDPAGRNRAVEILNSLSTRDQTNLAAGWFEGARQVALGISEASKSTNQILLLSDGMSNQGLRDPNELAEHASRLRETGISTSCIGIGDDYEITYLQALAEAGGGRLHDAQYAEDLADVVLGELGELRGTAYQDFRIVLSGPDHTEVDLLTPYRLEIQGGDLVAIVGSVVSGRQYSLIWRAKLPAGPVGMEISLVARAHWRDRETGEFQSSEPVSCSLSLQEEELNENQSRDPDITLEVLRQWHGWLMRHAMSLNRTRQFYEAEIFLQEQISHFERYCLGITGCEKFLEELLVLQRRIGTSMGERNRKEVTMRSFKMSRRERDYRIRGESDYRDFLD